MINVGFSNPSVPSPQEFQAARAARPPVSELIGQADSSLAPTLSPQQQADQSQGLAHVMGGIDQLRNPNPHTFSLENIFERLQDDNAVGQATRPNPNDTLEGAGIRKDYADAYNWAERKGAQAERLANQYGPGEHKLPNGETLTVAKNSDGTTSVTTTGANGVTQAVTVDENHPNKVNVFTQNADGHVESVNLDGTKVSVSQGKMQTVAGLMGGAINIPHFDTTTSYGLDGCGNPVRTNPDGSTETAQSSGTVSEVPGAPRPLRPFPDQPFPWAMPPFPDFQTGPKPLSHGSTSVQGLGGGTADSIFK